jgi:tetratricopeptide (TPR) repeat protein
VPRFRGRDLAYIAVVIALVLSSPSAGANELLGGVKAKLAGREQELKLIQGGEGLPAGNPFITKGRLYLETGRHDFAHAMVAELKDKGLEGRLLAAKILLANNDFENAGPLIQELIESASHVDKVRALAYRWWVVVDDLKLVDGTQKQRVAEGDASQADLLASANLSTMLLDFDGAAEQYEHALSLAATTADSGEAFHGLGVAFYRKRDFDASFDYLKRALVVSAPDPDLLMSTSSTLIRLGRTADAIEFAKLAVRISPYHERAHYLLGNGYSSKNYTELYAAYPGAFADEAGMAAIREADALLAEGKPSEARKAYEALRSDHSEWVEVPSRLGSLDFAERDYERARQRFGEALEICPEYGRAHNGMAKVLEAQRLEVEVHRDAYEEIFGATATPEIPGIEEFVVNWHALSPRHQKRVALSVEPWKRFIPVLVESGSTYYIKPLYELLSETPGQELLRDQRISYDSRLWDDVRGCGGYNTVTGIEDVERTILNRYNTVLHELTHQVHAVLPADRKREIQELYRKTKEKDQAGDDAFLSRYAGGSVWEYFAEGANSLESPRRDRYDTREIVRERLDEKDPELRGLVVVLTTEADVESCYAVAYSNRGDDRLGRGKPDEAIAAYEQAIERSPEEETALSSLVYALKVAGRKDEALALAEEKYRNNQESAVPRRSIASTWSWGDCAGSRATRSSPRKPTLLFSIIRPTIPTGSGEWPPPLPLPKTGPGPGSGTRRGCASGPAWSSFGPTTPATSCGRGRRIGLESRSMPACFSMPRPRPPPPGPWSSACGPISRGSSWREWKRSCSTRTKPPRSRRRS